MPSARAPKRRKISPEPGSDSDSAIASPAPASRSSGRKRTPTAAARQLAAPKSKPTPVGTPSEAVSVWQQAKAKKLAAKGGKAARELSRGAAKEDDATADEDAFDDIDGALVGREPYGRLSGRSSIIEEGRKTKTEARAKTAKKARANRGGKAAGFFAQFSRQAVEAREGRRSIAVGIEDSEEVDGEMSDELDDEDTRMNGMSDEENDYEHEHDLGHAQLTGSMKQSASGGRYWTTLPAGQRKKTFEDEIRDLEAAAKKQAEEDSSGDELASENELRQSSSRKDTRLKRTIRQRTETTEVASKPSTTKPLDRRKSNKVSAVAPRKAPLEASAEEMEICDSEDERAAPVSDKLAAVASKQITTPSKAKPVMPKKRDDIPSVSFEAQHLQCIQKVLMDKATGKRATPLTNLSNEYAKVFSLIDQTVTAGESNSMLLIGARGSGKTALVDHILKEQSVLHPDDHHVVRLNGFIHTDDKIALREIWRQLGREMEMEDADGPAKNYADTLSTLLALLSHPTEMGVDEPGQVTKSVIFVLDEFDLFATHPRQTLLYNLFDIAQSRKAPIAVLGLTTRIDVAESLEKRVKSRFSHRYVHLSMSKSLQAFEQVCRAAMAVAADELSSEEKLELGETTEVTAKLQLASSKTKARSTLSEWNSLVDYTLASEPCAKFLRRLFYTTKSVPEFLTSLALSIATLPFTFPVTSSTLFSHFKGTLAAPSLRAPDSKLILLSSLSVLQLALLISAARLTNIYNTEVISFNLAYDEYKNLASKAKLQASASGALAQGAGSRVWGKAVAKGAWEGLVDAGFVMEDGRGGRVDIAMEEIGGSGVDLGAWGRWCKEI